MEDLDRFEQLLKQHSFKKLSEEEKRLAYQFVSSEEEYESLRVSDNELKKFFDYKVELVPGENILRRIKESRSKEIQTAQTFWTQASIPAYAVALLIIVVGAFGWWSGARFGSEKVLVEKIVPKIDTVFIALKPDTVIKDRIIYLPSAPAAIASFKTKTLETSANKGVNMKEKEELEGLLVSGSY